MGDDITIGVTEIVNNIEVTAQPNDQIVDISVIDNTDEVTLNITPTVIEINVNKGSSYAKWGTILGILEDQTDLKDALDLKANLVDGKVPASELPSYVDDVIEVANYAALPTTGETGKIYVTLDNNKIYRWSGSVYIEIAANNAIWGAITGTLSNQTDLQTALNTKALKTITITPNAPLSGGGDLSANRTISISQSNTTTDGYLSSTDWNTFNSKQSALGYTAANDANVVHKTGNESIAGIKTFTDNIVSNTFYSSKIISGGYMPSAGYSNMYSNDLMLTFNQMNAAGTAVTTFNFVYPTSNTSRTYNLPNNDGTLALTSQLHNAVTIGTANGLSLSTQVLSLGLASSSANGALSSTDWSTFNGKQNAISNLIDGNVSTGYIPKSTFTTSGLTTLGNSKLYEASGTILNDPTANSWGYQINGSSTTGQSFGAVVVAGTNSSDISFEVRNQAGNVSYLKVVGDGKVGIGTSSPSEKLEVNGNGLFGIAKIGTWSLGGGAYARFGHTSYDGGTNFGFLQSSSGVNYINGETNYISGTSTNIFETSATERMRIDSSGNVLIGTTTDAGYKLDVNGTGRFSSSITANSQLYLAQGGTNRYSLEYVSGSDFFSIGRSGVAYDFVLKGGNVGIGTTSPAAKLHVGESGAAAQLWLQRTDGYNPVKLIGGTLSDGSGFKITMNTTDAFAITSSGNVGIGTTSPVGKLTVSGSSASGSIMSIDTSSTTSFVRILADISSQNLLNWQTGTDFRFATSNQDYSSFSERMRITSGGSVTIANLGTGLVYSNGGALTSTNPSDSRLKDDITDLQYGLNEILKLRPVSYNWKNDNINQGKQFGFIAQEVQEVMPELVKEFETEEGERLGLDKEGIYAALVNAIQEQQKQIEELKKLINK
jgi:hypothetical protein